MKISIVVPVYNEEKLIIKCLDSLIRQDYPKDDYEIVVVNDGSTDNTPLAIKEKQKDAEIHGVSVRLVDLEKNSGRVIAREVGAKTAKFDNLLFTDARCVADRNLLNVLKRIDYQPIVGNALIELNRSIFDRFGWIVRKKLYAPHFGYDFDSYYITPENYDDVPKATTVFFCDRALFLSSQPVNKNKDVSDDIALLRNIADKKDILRRSDVRVTYLSRTYLGSEINHMFWRGLRFTDYYLDFRKKYFWLFIFLPTLAVTMAIFLSAGGYFDYLYAISFLAVVWILISIWPAENLWDFFIVFLLLPVFIISFEAGVYYSIPGRLLKLLKR